MSEENIELITYTESSRVFCDGGKGSLGTLALLEIPENGVISCPYCSQKFALGTLNIRSTGDILLKNKERDQPDVSNDAPVSCSEPTMQ